MGVRVPLRIYCGDKSITVAALVNSGFESSEPDIAVPINVARGLGLWPPRDFRLDVVRTAGREVTVFRLKTECRAELLDINIQNTLVSTRSNIIVDEHLDQVLISDYLIDELGIIVVSFRKGLWRHVSDKQDVVRPSFTESRLTTF